MPGRQAVVVLIFSNGGHGLKHLRDSCGLPAATGVALETGTSAFFVARELARLELKPVVIDAHEVRRKAQRPEQKSDTRDALELCEGLRRGFYRSIVHVPSPAISDLRTTLSRRRHFIRIQTAEVNAVKRLLRGVRTKQRAARQLAHRRALAELARFNSKASAPSMACFASWARAATFSEPIHEFFRRRGLFPGQAFLRLSPVMGLLSSPGLPPVLAISTSSSAISCAG